ncbi:MAG: cytochrome P450, partial [Ignavibacteriales bacterium]|nr:cytochrome P450 [Ignavibacteriales bacterium]
MSSSNIPTPSFLSGLFLKKKFLANPAEACLELSQTYGDIVRFSLSGNSFTLINSQSLIENILETNQGNYLHIVEHAPVTGFLSEDFYGKHNPELGDGLLSSLNRITIPETLPLFYPVIEEEVAVIKEQYRTSKTSADKINIELEMQRLFIKIIARGLLAPGLEINADSLQESMVDITSFNSFANLLKVRTRSGTLPGKSRIQSMLPKYVVESFTYLDEMADHIGADFMGALAERSPFLEILHSHLKGHNTDYQKIIETIKATFFTTSLPLSQVAT